MPPRCQHDWSWVSGDEHQGNGFRFRTYQCWKCQGWGYGALRMTSGEVRYLPPCAVDDRDQW